jgi:Ni/Co efflux regulator RcnB
MMKPLVLGTMLSLLVSSAALAVPTASPGQQPALHYSSDMLKIGRGDDRDRHWKGKRAFHDDDRYRGKKRYSYRPDDWEDRGCVSVGPFWYCS